jgi:AhpD family alkylhydroperoxidase
MKSRLDLVKVAPSVYQSMAGVEKVVHSFNLNVKLLHLVKLRVSQINGCGYCVNMHSRDARKAGESEQRVFTVSTWWEVPFFTEAEQVLFRFAEEVTRINKKGLTEQTYQDVIAHYGEEQFAGWLYAITAINTWNRLAISVHSVAEADH